MQTRLAAGETRAAALVAAGRSVVHNEPGIALEYLEAVDPASLLPVETVTPGILVAIAARVGQTRLIDNFVA
jgi:pantoate--beta-alanine ligase